MHGFDARAGAFDDLKKAYVAGLVGAGFYRRAIRDAWHLSRVDLALAAVRAGAAAPVFVMDMARLYPPDIRYYAVEVAALNGAAAASDVLAAIEDSRPACRGVLEDRARSLKLLCPR